MAVAQPHVEPLDHAVVSSHRCDDELRDKVGRFLTDALAAGGVAMIAATSERTRAFEGSDGVPRRRGLGNALERNGSFTLCREEVATSLADGDLTGEPLFVGGNDRSRSGAEWT